MVEWWRLKNLASLWLIGIILLLGCQSAQKYREGADKTAASIIESKQKEALGRTEPFTIERPSDSLRRRLLQEQE